MTVVRLTAADAGRYVRLRRRALASEPWAFTASPDDDRASDPDHVARMLEREQNVVLAALAPDGELAGVAGLARGAAPKFRHRATIWGVFVEPTHRGRGLGRALLAAAIDLARTWTGVDFLDIGVSAHSPEAHRLYLRLGFVEWGRQPDALEHDGRRHDEIFMALRLA